MTEIGRKFDPGPLFDAIGVISEEATQNVESDYGLAFTRELGTIMPLLGTRCTFRLVVPAFGAAETSGIQIGCNRPDGMWIDEVFCDFDSNALLRDARQGLYLVNNATQQLPYLWSFDYPSAPAILGASSGSSEGLTVYAGSMTGAPPQVFPDMLAFVLGGNGITSRIGGPIWLPSRGLLTIFRNALNAAWSGTISLRFLGVVPP